MTLYDGKRSECVVIEDYKGACYCVYPAEERGGRLRPVLCEDKCEQCGGAAYVEYPYVEFATEHQALSFALLLANSEQFKGAEIERIKK